MFSLSENVASLIPIASCFALNSNYSFIYVLIQETNSKHAVVLPYCQGRLLTTLVENFTVL